QARELELLGESTARKHPRRRLCQPARRGVAVDPPAARGGDCGVDLPALDPSRVVANPDVHAVAWRRFDAAGYALLMELLESSFEIPFAVGHGVEKTHVTVRGFFSTMPLIREDKTRQRRVGQGRRRRSLFLVE